MKITSSKPLSLAEVKEVLEDREKEGGQLSYEQQQVLEHAKKFATSTLKDNKALAKKLEANKKLNNDAIVKIIDLKPKKAETLKLMLVKDKIELTDEEIGEILKIVAD